MVHDMYLFEVRSPAESKGRWDDYKLSRPSRQRTFQSLESLALPAGEEIKTVHCEERVATTSSIASEAKPIHLAAKKEWIASSLRSSQYGSEIESTTNNNGKPHPHEHDIVLQSLDRASSPSP